MSETQDITVEDEDEYQDRRQELIAEAAEHKQELEESQNQALEEIAAGEKLEEYETVELGELEMEVKAWLPGHVEDAMTDAGELAESGDPSGVRESKQTMLAALADMTTNEDYSKSFWREYADRYGQNGLIVAIQRVMGPARENMEAKSEAVDGFRTKSERP